MSRLTINHKADVATRLSCSEIFYSYIFYKFIVESASEKKLFKSVNTWQNCRPEGGYRGAILLGIESAPLSEDEDEDENDSYMTDWVFHTRLFH